MQEVCATVYIFLVFVDGNGECGPSSAVGAA